MNRAFEVSQRILENVKKVIVGKDDQIRQVICCWAAGGHALIEDAPGTGKTILARAITKSVDMEFKRVQFTPDLLPSDLLGTSVYNQSTGVFDFIKGPLFTSVFLGDEINRAAPRTQSALLESMSENQITVDGVTRALHPSFFVIATQNPVEQQGTFPLPEAQLDRFMMKLSIGYPTPEQEIQIAINQNFTHPITQLKSVETAEGLETLRRAVPEIKISESVYRYIVKIIEKTRSHADLKLGASPRATVALIRACQAMALINGFDYVDPTHVFALTLPVLAHRLILTPDARLEGKAAAEVLEGIRREVPVPTK